MKWPWQRDGGPRISRIEPVRCALFYRYLRLEALVHVERADDSPGAPELRAWIDIDGGRPPRGFQSTTADAGRTYSVVVDALIDPELFPEKARLRVTLGASHVAIDLVTFARATFDRNGIGALSRGALTERIDAFIATPGARRPRLLDLGGRRRSGRGYSDDLTQCDVTVFDIVADASVDVVGDAHELSRYFPAEHFDFVISVSVFEHLLMPWKVALELNKVMRTGGECFIHTHQTLGMHELPWDFWRFSDTAWQGLFNARTGFEIVKTGLGIFIHLVTAGWDPHYRGGENSGGFESSQVLVRKIGPSDLAWDVRLRDVIATSYPGMDGPGA
jgi:hypothetical protein